MFLTKKNQNCWFVRFFLDIFDSSITFKSLIDSEITIDFFSINLYFLKTKTLSLLNLKNIFTMNN
jgi:hypothetical protein